VNPGRSSAGARPGGPWPSEGRSPTTLARGHTALRVHVEPAEASPLRPVAFDGSAATFQQRALTLWPRLDRTQLARTGGDPARIARIVGRRTTLPPESIVAMLTGEPIAEPDAGRSRPSMDGLNSAIDAHGLRGDTATADRPTAS
jgi:hypothetical protein